MKWKNHANSIYVINLCQSLQPEAFLLLRIVPKATILSSNIKLMHNAIISFFRFAKLYYYPPVLIERAFWVLICLWEQVIRVLLRGISSIRFAVFWHNSWLPFGWLSSSIVNHLLKNYICYEKIDNSVLFNFHSSATLRTSNCRRSSKSSS